jgi:hypothetical protein
MTRSVPAAVLAFAFAATALADVTVTRDAADPGEPSPAARTCELRFRPHTPVVTSCDQSCYMESWDGPVLMAANTCSHVIWASYVFAAEDGRTWRTPCYELSPGLEGIAIPEASLGPWSDRRVVIAQEPGTPGYKYPAPTTDCPTAREVQPSTTGR